MADEAIEENRLSYRESRPGVVLEEYVQCFAEFAVDPDCPPFEHRIVPDGCCHVSFVRGPRQPMGQLSIVGPRLGPLVFPMHGGQVCWDVKLRPGACEPLLGVAVEDVVDDVIAAAGIAPRVHAAVQSGLTESRSAGDAWRVFAEAFLGWLAGAPPVDPPVARAVRLIEESGGRAPIAEAAATAGVSERELQRRFQRLVGLSPKQFARIRRLRSCVGNMIREEPEQWGIVAVRHGYSDQAHLTREFAELSGLPPTALQPYIRSIAHHDVIP